MSEKANDLKINIGKAKKQEVIMITYFVKKRNQKGFTLIELMIVIAIIAILAAIAIPQFSAYRARGWMATVKSDAKNCFTAIQMWSSDNPGVAPVAENIASGTAGAIYTGARASVGTSLAVAAGGGITASHSSLNGTYVLDANGLVPAGGDTLAAK